MESFLEEKNQNDTIDQNSFKIGKKWSIFLTKFIMN